MAYISACQSANESVEVGQQNQLNAQQAEFLRLYLGRDKRYRDNGTRSYMKAYDCTNERTAQACSSRLVNDNPVIAAAIQQARELAMQNLGVNAEFVLAQSLRLLDRAMGDEAIEVEVVDKVKQADGSILHVPRIIEVRRYDPAVASKQIEQIGRHTSVQAFQDNVEHTHTHYLEQRLAQRHKQIEQRAAQRNEALEGTYTTDDAGAGEGEKRVHRGGGHDRAAAAPGETTLPAAGASGK